MSSYGDFAVMVFSAFALAFVVGLEWPRAPACPESLADGRVLLSHTYNGKETRCKYAPPRGTYEFSPEELRRMARAKERMTATR